MNEQEVWRDITGHKGKYQISNIGRIKSLKRIVFSKSGYSFVVHEKITFGNKKPNGYYVFNLKRGGSSAYISRLVAQAFIPNPDNKPHVNHIDGVPANNKVANLEWCTHKENMRHAWRTGLFESSRKKARINCGNRFRGEKSYTSKLSNRDVLSVRKLHNKGKSNTELGKIYRVDQSTISNIIHRKTWKHI